MTLIRLFQICLPIPICLPIIAWFTVIPLLPACGGNDLGGDDETAGGGASGGGGDSGGGGESVRVDESSEVNQSISSIEHSVSPQHLVSQLDSPIFSKRRGAFRSLLKQGTSANKDLSNRIGAAVRHGLRHPSMEVRLATADLLKRFVFHRIESQLNQLRDPRVSAESIDIDQWKSFSAWGGEDMLSRNFFAKLYLQFPALLRTPTSSFHCDPSKLRRNDSTGWAMLLWMTLDANARHPTARHPNARNDLGVLLSQSSFGPIIDLKPGSVVLSRLVGSWISNTPTSVVPMVQKFRIALRYNQTDMANQLIDQVFSDPYACPRSRIAALLAASALDHHDVAHYATTSLQDGRNVSGWTFVTSPRRRIRTQVRDVGLAVLLQDRGIDPRAAGYDFLEADPILIFRGQSLGFPNQSSRQAAHDRGHDLLRRIQIAP